MAKNIRTYSDIDLRFIAHPITGDVGILTDELAVKAAVKNLVMTQFFERKFNSGIGSTVNSLLFEQHTVMLDVLIKNAIKETILNFEPRVDLIDVVVLAAPDNNSLYITIEFRIKNTTRPISLSIELERTR